MPENCNRSDDYRYTVALQGSDITPLASIDLFFGPQKFRVLNISIGGLALLFSKEPKVARGDIVDASLQIRERAFPVQVEVKSIRGFRVSCSFVSPSKVFLGALREFLKPKFLGSTLTLAMSDAKPNYVEFVQLVNGAELYQSYIGQNQTAVFIWMDRERKLQKLVSCSGDLVFEWSGSEGLKTGRLVEPLETPEPVAAVKWDRVAESPLLHYFADILLAWLHFAEGPEFVEALMASEEGFNEERPLRFPKI